MRGFAQSILMGWIPISMVLFFVMPPKKAVIVSTIVAWLFLPVAALPLPGLPDLTKASAAMIGCLLGVLLLDSASLSRLRPHIVDLPLLGWIGFPILTSVDNGLGLYDGVSSALTHSFVWGLPYVVGRVSLGSPERLRDLAIGMIVGGLVYAPFCLLETRISPQLHRLVYGYSPSHMMHAIRYGGYRPIVFMTNGLEVGMWMAASSMMAWQLWAAGGLRRLGGLPFGTVLMPALLITTVLCKSTGAIMLAVAGLVILWLIRKTKSRLPIFLLLFLPVFYQGGRTSGVWEGRSAVEFVTNTIGADRAESLEFRMNNEDILMGKALERPLLGWGGWGRARVYNDQGEDITITDGLWIIALGNFGTLGLISLNGILLLPPALFALWPSRYWRAPELTAASTFAVLLVLYMIDCISNAMVNPIYILSAGGLASIVASPRPSLDVPADPGLDLAVAYGPPGSDQGGLPRPPRGLAPDELERELGSVRDRIALLPEPTSIAAREALAIEHVAAARLMAELGRTAEALEVRYRALDLFADLANLDKGNPEAARRWADCLNDTSWLITRSADADPDDLERAIPLARKAIQLFPDDPTYWNTLGAACCLRQDWRLADEALTRSLQLGGPPSFNHFLLAIVHKKLGHYGFASRHYRSGLDLMTEALRDDPELIALKAQAEAVVFGEPNAGPG